jgi:transcriptional regulator with XRE-family HTH domain
MKQMKAIRQRQRLTQAQLAEAAGVSQAHISKAERGDDSLSLSVVYAIAEALEALPCEMFAEDGLQARIICASAQLSGRDREMAARILEAMLGD